MPQVGQTSARPTGGLEWGRVIGLPVAVGDLASVSREVIRRAQSRCAGHVCLANVHMLVTARRDLGLRRVLDQAAIVVSDGLPLVWRLRWRGFGTARQVRGPDLTVAICAQAAEEGVPVYFYGGDARLMAELSLALSLRFPRLHIVGAEPGPVLPVRPEVDPAVVERIRASGAAIVFVGLGCPKQEFWMAAYGPHLDAVLLGVGQAFAIVAGRMAEAPLWMRRAGFEWLYRLMAEPRRLWRRYLVTNSLFAAFLVREMFVHPGGNRRLGSRH